LVSFVSIHVKQVIKLQL